MTETIQQRVLAVKLQIDWSNPADKALAKRLTDLSWQAARYRNCMMRRTWAEAMGWRIAEGSEGCDKHGITKQGRKTEKDELSSAVYGAAENEVRAAWTRDAKLILAGRPLPEWRVGAALSIRGHKKKSDSGVQIEYENEQYVAYLSVQSKDCEGGCKLRCPIAPHTKRDEWQAPLLDRMVAWQTPIARATVEIKRHKIIVRLTYARKVELPAAGARCATLGPIRQDGRLLLRTELQTRDYTPKLAEMLAKKDGWDLIRRRVMAQIGRRKGHARAKREKLAEMTTERWVASHLHTWTADIVQWLAGQGVGSLRVANLETRDWPAHRFTEMLRYKCADRGITLTETPDIREASGERTAKAAITKDSRAIGKRRQAIREIRHQVA